jgi:4a-hydroxytetrahydrobiopterin dehydratase
MEHNPVPREWQSGRPQAFSRFFVGPFSRGLRIGLANPEEATPVFARNPEHLIHMSDLLDTDELNAALKKCPEWEYDKKANAITRTVEFEEFSEAIDFVNDLAEIADEAQHHPEILIRHTRVTLKLTTHDVGGLTDLDIELAQRVDNLVD